MNDTVTNANEVTPLMERILYEVKRIVVGQDHFLERVLVAILAQGHLLVEGVPGLAKTLTVKTLARTIRGSFKRIQFTPDLVPADLVGTRIYNQKTASSTRRSAPSSQTCCSPTKSIGRPAKVQSALLEVMQEYQVTIAGETHWVPSPFLVMATQNPIETEGTYPLPEAQVDRFMMKVLVGYPSEEEEFVIVERVTGVAQEVAAVATTEELALLQRDVPQWLRRSVADPVRRAPRRGRRASRTVRHQGSRAIPHLRREPAGDDPPDRGRAGARLPARADYVLPEDVSDLAPDVLRHRLSLSYEALADGQSADQIVQRIMQHVHATGEAARDSCPNRTEIRRARERLKPS
jgi:MoxR-like ATPase